MADRRSVAKELQTVSQITVFKSSALTVQFFVRSVKMIIIDLSYIITD